MHLRPWLRGGVRVIVTKRRWRILVNCDHWNALWRRARAAGCKDPLEFFMKLVRQSVR